MNATSPPPQSQPHNNDDIDSSNQNNDNNKSALQDNLDRKGKNAYYFAHAHKATGPAWDGKEQPQLLRKGTAAASSRSNRNSTTTTSSFDMTHSTITSYAFLDDGPKVKLYVTLEQLDTQMDDDDDDDNQDDNSSTSIQLEWTERTLSLVVRNYHHHQSTTTSPPTRTTGRDATLRVARLAGPITKASFRRKRPNRIVVTLQKAATTRTTMGDSGGDRTATDVAEESYATWHTLHDTGSPEHVIV